MTIRSGSRQARSRSRIESDRGTEGLVKVNWLGQPHQKGERALFVDPGALSAYRAMVRAAEQEGYSTADLSITSAYRSEAQQPAALAEAIQKHGKDLACKYVACGASEHFTGRALDFGLGGLSPLSENIAAQRQLPIYSWLVDNAGDFGFNPYQEEPWHWSYNVIK